MLGSLKLISIRWPSRYAKQVTFVASCIQAAVSLATFLIVNNLIAPSEYAIYSNTIATALWANSVLFEWIRITASRFFHFDSAKDAEGAVVFNSLLIGLIISLAIGIAVGAIMWLAGLASIWLIMICLTVATTQGAGDTFLTMLRMGRHYNRFSTYSMIRVVGFLVASGIAAGVTRQASFALSAYAIFGIVFVISMLFQQRAFYRVQFNFFDPKLIWRYLKFGGMAGLASMVHQLTLLCVRWQAAATLPRPQVAAIAIAFDILYRPFAVLAVSINGAMLPDTVHEEEASSRGDVRPRLRRLLELHIYMSILAYIGLSTAGYLMLMRMVRRESITFLHANYNYLLIFCLVSVFIQAALAIPVQLVKKSSRLIFNGLIQFAAVGAAAKIAQISGHASRLPEAIALANLIALSIGMVQLWHIPEGIPKTEGATGFAVVAAILLLQEMFSFGMAAGIALASIWAALMTWKHLNGWRRSRISFPA
jgi:O-antigen/teichoic acid export membrane protein